VAGTVSGPGFANAGLGYRSAPLVTPANPQRPDGGFGPLRLRLPEKVVDAEGLSAGCALTVDTRPLWRFNAQPQVSAFAAGQLSQITCPAPRLLTAVAPDVNTVRLTFDRNIDANTVTPAAFTIASLTVTAATVSGKTVELKTSAITPEQDYTVSVSADVKDVRQTGVSAAANSATFRVVVAGPGPAVVLSQIYGGGGNANATLKSDFVELHNRSNMPVSLAGWSLHYASATSMSAKTSGKTTFAPGTSIPAGGYLLVEGASGGDAGMPAPAADALFGEPDAGLVNLGATNGKVFLSARADDVLLGADGCPVADSGVIGAFAYGTGTCKIDGVSTALSNTTAASRKENGCALTGPAAADFEVKAPAPRNSASPAVICP
jgi:Lamin Tail Domain/Bacterial Ig-like domain